MKIANIEISRKALALTRPYTIAYKTTSEVEICVVKVQTESGLTGLGSANPSPYVVGEDMNACIAALNSEGVSKLIGRDIRNLNKLCADLHEMFPQNPGAKAALDIAFHDLLGQYLEIPVVEYLGQHIDRLATSITIGIKNVEETLEEAEEYIGNGFRILKVKLGHSVEEDVERIQKLRERFGFDIGIRVDANQGYNQEDLMYFTQNTTDAQLELIEQPMKADNIEGMRNLPWDIRKLLAADESLVDADDAFHLVNPERATGIFNIKLMKCGGIFQARRIAEVARLANCSLMWGCNDESIISITAALHAAFASPHTRFIDLDGSLDLAVDVVKGGFILENGMMRPNGKPGLGLSQL